MIDDAVMVDYIRDANPVPNLDEIDPDELTRSAAATETRRAAAMHAPTQPPTEFRPTPPRRHRAGWAFAVAFVVVLVGVGIAALVLRTTEAPVSDEPVTETTVVDAPTETTVVDAPIEPTQLESLIWSRVSVDGDMSSVTVGGPGLVALGEADDHAAVWTSPDGYSWSRVPHDESVFGTDAVRWAMRSATAGGPGLVAVGSQLSGWGRPGGDAALVWTSPDGMSWTRVAHDAVFDDGDMASVTAGGPGLVAVGSIGNTAAVWTSQDGETWSRAVVLRGQTARPSGLSVVTDVTVGGPGLVAVGRDTSSAAVWTSPDGNTWTPTSQDESVFGGEGIQGMSSVTTGGPGLIAVGDDHGRAAVWTSIDGFVWSRVPHDPEIFGDEIMPQWDARGPLDYYDDEHPMREVITTDSGLVAVGSAITGADAGGDPLNRAAVWTSRDGSSWSRILYNKPGSTTDHETEPLGTPQNMRMESVTENGPVLVAVGTYARGDRTTVWVAEP